VRTSGSKRSPKQKRRKSHQLPTFPPNHYSYPNSHGPDGKRDEPPHQEGLRLLAQRHGFPPDFDLAEEIEDRWFWWRFDTVTGRMPPATVQRQFLREVSKRAAAIEEAIDKLPDDLRDDILESVGGPAHLNLHQLKWSAHFLRMGCIAAVKKIPPSRRGARGNPELIRLLLKLFRLYRRAFGTNAARITKADRYGGRFFEFANDVLVAFGIHKSNQALGKAIEKAIADARRRDRMYPRNSGES
jgi:hypothetical protein